ncbi:MAG: 23S rRNA (adenine(2503)-C(2))-methyltransferase RlmN [Acidobacteria bacterium]|nr:23S rRNA (adenine(2503)-C(2))-methyltransferase RlmN [Acidobacteriota bacterium]
MSSPRSRNLYDVRPSDLPAILAGHVTPAYRIAQIADWLYQHHVHAFDAMTNLPQETRDRLAAEFSLSSLQVVDQTPEASDGSRKYLFALPSEDRIETVHMPMGARTTICVSSQAGCAVGCTFCVTGFFGPGVNLPPSVILEQIHSVQEIHSVDDEQLNVVFMGMGEPLLNTESLDVVLDILALSISLRRVTLSTSGITPGLRWLAERPDRPNLAVSINAPDQARREEIMPISKRYPLAEIIEALRAFPLEHGRTITAEYVLLAGWNDSPADAEALAKLLRGIDIKVNAIPFNPDPTLPDWMTRPSDAAIDRFAAALAATGTRVTVRRSKGLDIAAACGQLRGRSERKGRGEKRPARI